MDSVVEPSEDSVVVPSVVESEVDPAVVALVDFESEVPVVVSSEGFVFVHATNAKQSRIASTPASNLLVNMAFSFLCT